MRQFRGAFLLFGLLVVQAFAQALPAEPRVPPKAALVDFQRSPIVALLESELLAANFATWVERNGIERVLDEQKLQLFFAAEAGVERVRLGQILKADILVLTRSGQVGEVPYVQIVVSEVARGLRLLNRTLPLTDKSPSDVAELVQMVRDGIARQGQQTQAIYAVPPLLSDDLLYDQDDLRIAYAHLIEQELLEQPGVLVVELAEAEALSREVALAEPQAQVSRQLPYYLLGRYRNENGEHERRINIQLVLKRGASELETITQTLKPHEAPDFLRQTTRSIAARLSGQQPKVRDVQAEAEQLARRGKDYLRLGNWEESLAMVHASLLLKPNQPDLEHHAVVALTNLMNKHWNNRNFELEKAQATMGYCFRGLSHIATFYRQGGTTEAYLQAGKRHFVHDFRSAAESVWAHTPLKPEVKEYLTGAQERYREMILQLVQVCADQRNDQEAASCLTWAVQRLPSGKQFELRFQLILKNQNLPGATARTVLFSHQGYGIGILKSVEGQQFLDLLTAQGNSEVQAAVTAMRRSLDADLEREKRKSESKPATQTLEQVAPGGLVAHFEPLNWTWSDASGNSGKVVRIDGCLPTSEGLDLVWNGSSLYLMRQKGVLKRVWFSAQPDVYFTLPHDPRSKSAICFDGRFIWGTVHRRGEPPWLIVLDPTTEKSWEIAAADGLPLVTPANSSANRTYQTLSIAAVGPGQVCVCGGFGRAWLAMIHFAPSEGAKIHVFHEAKESAAPEDREQWRNSRVAFTPTHMFMLEGATRNSSTPERRLVIARSNAGIEVGDHPLVVNPETLEVSVLTDVFRAETKPLEVCQHAGAVYFVGSKPPERKEIVLMRLGLPGPSVKVAMTLPREGYPIFFGDQLNIVGKQWWIGELETQAVVPAGPVPWQFINRLRAGETRDFRDFQDHTHGLVILANSHHYGLLTVSMIFRTGKWTLSQASFQKAIAAESAKVGDR